MSLDNSGNMGISRAAQRALDQNDAPGAPPKPRNDTGQFTRREERGGLSRRQAARQDDDLSKVTDILTGKKDFRGVTRDESERQPGSQADRSARSGKGSQADLPESDLEDLDAELEPYQQPRKGQKKTIAKFAEEHGIDPKDLYGLVLPFDDPDEQPMTVQELKDSVGKVRSHQHERDEFELYKTDSLNEIYSARQQFDGLMASIRDLVTPEQLATAFHQSQETWKMNQQRAHAELRELFPEWADERQKRADITELYEFGKKWRFSKQEMDSLNDSRIVYFMMKMMQREKIFQRFRSEREKKPTETPVSKRQYRPDVKQQARDLAKKGDPVAAVAKLIGG